MATVHEELHAIVDQLDEGEAQNWLEQMREREEKRSEHDSSDWHERMRDLRARLKAKYGEFPSAADMVNEAREERSYARSTGALIRPLYLF